DKMKAEERRKRREHADRQTGSNGMRRGRDTQNPFATVPEGTGEGAARPDQKPQTLFSGRGITALKKHVVLLMRSHRRDNYYYSAATLSLRSNGTVSSRGK